MFEDLHEEIKLIRGDSTTRFAVSGDVVVATFALFFVCNQSKLRSVNSLELELINTQHESPCHRCREFVIHSTHAYMVDKEALLV